MDNELRNFKQKIRKIPKATALVWITILGYKLSFHYVKRRFFKGSKRKFQYSTNIVPTQSYKIQGVNFLNGSHGVGDESFNVPDNFTLLPDWQRVFQDEQDLHLLHRMKELPFCVRKENSHGHLYKYIQHWNSNNPMGSLPGWHPYTLSERLISMCWTLDFISKKRMNDELEQLLRTTILVQANFLRNNFEFHLGHHNHLINNARALLTASTLLRELPQAAEWRKFAIKIFKQEWPYQLLPDGVHAEQSLTYHFLLTRTLWEMKYLMEQNEEQFPFDEDLGKMIRYASAATRPDVSIPFLGHLTPDWHWKELVGLLPVWTSSLASTSNLGKLYKQSISMIYVSGENQSGVFLYSAAGQGILRTEKVHAVLSCDPRCIITVHGDQNFLGLDVWYLGTHLIRDAGLASYNLDSRRAWYESWQGQSTFSIDGFDPIVSSWRKRQLPKEYFSVTSNFQCDKEKRILKASHTGYCRLPDPVNVERQINLQGENELYIEDSLQSKGQHTYSAKFHFGKNAMKQLSDRSIHLHDLVNGNTFELCWNAELEFSMEENPFTTAYGQESMGNTVTFKCTFTGNTKIKYLLKPL